MTQRAPAPAPRPGLRERKKARTKAAIQEHALRLFAAQGYQQTTIDQIADAAEVSPSTFFRYFGDQGGDGHVRPSRPVADGELRGSTRRGRCVDRHAGNLARGGRRPRSASRGAGTRAYAVDHHGPRTTDALGGFVRPGHLDARRRHRPPHRTRSGRRGRAHFGRGHHRCHLRDFRPQRPSDRRRLGRGHRSGACAGCRPDSGSSRPPPAGRRLGEQTSGKQWTQRPAPHPCRPRRAWPAGRAARGRPGSPRR